MATSTKESGKMAKPTATVYLLTLMEACMRESGSMTSSMDMAQNRGTTTRSNIQVTFKTARNLAVDALNLKEVIMREILSMGSFTALESIILPILVNFTKVNLKLIIWKEKEL